MITDNQGLSVVLATEVGMMMKKIREKLAAKL
jgi:hypothetical protein